MIVSFLSDFGLEDDFVGVCRGVIKRISPETEVIDLTHGIAPQNILQGALVLRATLRYMPVGVHLAVVDPGVGGKRRAVALRSGDGRLFVGPDNGLLVPAAESAGGIEAARELKSDDHRLHPVSRTFHGRDVFAPAAAHLAARCLARRARPSDRAGDARAHRPCRSRSWARRGFAPRCSTSTGSATSS